jgi:hypothetical protein
MVLKDDPYVIAMCSIGPSPALSCFPIALVPPPALNLDFVKFFFLKPETEEIVVQLAASKILRGKR